MLGPVLYIEANLVGEKVLKHSLAIRRLLGHEASSGKHGKTSVLKLLGDHDIVLLWVRWFEANWVEANITGTVVVKEETWLGDGYVTWVDPINSRTTTNPPLHSLKKVYRRTSVFVIMASTEH